MGYTDFGSKQDFYDRLLTKDNLEKRGVILNSSSLCVGGCGSEENVQHLFFNFLMLLLIVWKESLKWLEVSTTFLEGGVDHLKMFKGLVLGEKKVNGILGVIWVANIFVISKARNAVVFRHEGALGRVSEEAKVLSWRILRNRSKDFTFPLYQWLTYPLARIGSVKI
ncbi:hypothetical protein L195_g012341 [Trifolium pratense]|uniref:Uncharacterized protein n=1 Tax=Trifolium pratense TaxID=57577 RepID=A0A2K3LA82_TRIPR|nr:hypothetical protein L195_g029994 [Trifolium pratense]PNX75433.1 hypothetical protein L195_g031369 [Trifolium pratense]PNY15640.1 hypothetical protein L195_g012341 [Trifolium pratense]